MFNILGLSSAIYQHTSPTHICVHTHTQSFPCGLLALFCFPSLSFWSGDGFFWDLEVVLFCLVTSPKYSSIILLVPSFLADLASYSDRHYSEIDRQPQALLFHCRVPHQILKDTEFLLLVLLAAGDTCISSL